MRNNTDKNNVYKTIIWFKKTFIVRMTQGVISLEYRVKIVGGIHEKLLRLLKQTLSLIILL